MRSCEARKALDVEPFLWIERSQQVRSDMYPNVPGKIGDTATPAGYTCGKAARRSSKDQVEWLHLQPCLVPSWWWVQQKYMRLLKTVTYFDSSWGCYPCDPPQSKSGCENEWNIWNSKELNLSKCFLTCSIFKKSVKALNLSPTQPIWIDCHNLDSSKPLQISCANLTSVEPNVIFRHIKL